MAKECKLQRTESEESKFYEVVEMLFLVRMIVMVTIVVLKVLAIKVKGVPTSEIIHTGSNINNVGGNLLKLIIKTVKLK